MQAEDRIIVPDYLRDEWTNPVLNLQRRMETLRAEFMCVQQDSAMPIPESLARLDVLRTEIRQTFAQLQVHSHSGMP